MASFSGTAFSAGEVRIGAGESERRLEIPVGETLILHLPSPAEEILVGDAESLEAVLRTRSTVYLFAQALGRADVFVVGVGGRRMVSLDVHVVQDLSLLRLMLDRLVPDHRVNLDSIESRVVLSASRGFSGAVASDS